MCHAKSHSHHRCALWETHVCLTISTSWHLRWKLEFMALAVKSWIFHPGYSLHGSNANRFGVVRLLSILRHTCVIFSHLWVCTGYKLYGCLSTHSINLSNSYFFEYYYILLYYIHDMRDWPCPTYQTCSRSWCFSQSATWFHRGGPFSVVCLPPVV